MSHEIIIPPVGESVTTALVSRWHHADGDSVLKGQVIVTLETDKVSPEIEAEVSGIISITVPEGEEVAIGAVIGSISESVPAANSAPASKPAPAAAPASDSSPAPAPAPTGEVVDILMPAAGESITSGTLAAWSVSDGDFVKKGAVILTVDTDKVSQEIEAQASGLVTIEVTEGTEVSIGEKLGTIAVSDAPAVS
ncbi:MAG: pyruvate/2-oxoglutarate dehydrogenase complex dihydrolipoamide acyltransferase (E2) component, partial [Paracoccaceae bacterium]